MDRNIPSLTRHSKSEVTRKAEKTKLLERSGNDLLQGSKQFDHGPP
jgi:hypothetical protein